MADYQSRNFIDFSPTSDSFRCLEFSIHWLLHGCTMWRYNRQYGLTDKSFQASWSLLANNYHEGYFLFVVFFIRLCIPSLFLHSFSACWDVQDFLLGWKGTFWWLPLSLFSSWFTEFWKWKCVSLPFVYILSL